MNELFSTPVSGPPAGFPANPDPRSVQEAVPDPQPDPQYGPQPPEADGAERRRHPRYSCDGSAEVMVPNAGLRFRGRIQNLSVSGCFVETDFRLERGTQLEVCFETRRLYFRVSGVAAAPQKKRGVGIAFLTMTPRRALQIDELVAELKEETETDKAADSHQEDRPAQSVSP